MKIYMFSFLTIGPGNWGGRGGHPGYGGYGHQGKFKSIFILNFMKSQMVYFKFNTSPLEFSLAAVIKFVYQKLF